MKEQEAEKFPFLNGGGETGGLIRTFNWATTPLGSPDTWPAALKQIVAQMLSNPFPMLICWGKDFIQLYNDAFRPINGENKHPQALGGSARDTYAEIWDTIGPMFANVMNGQAVGFPNFMVPLNRNGYTEDCYFDFSYSPIKDETGAIHGVLVICMETTDRVLALANLAASNDHLVASEARLDQVIKQLPISITMLMGEEFIIERTNPSNLAYWQKTAAEVVGNPLLEALPELDGQAFPGQLKQVLATGDSIFEVEHPVKLVARDGTVNTTFVDYSYQPLTDQAGKRVGVLVMSNDVSDKVKSRNLLEKFAKELQAINEESAATNEELSAINEELFATQYTLKETIEDLQLSEQRVRVQQQRLERFFMQAPAGVSILSGPEFVFELVNPLYQQLFPGRSLLNNSLLTAIPEVEGTAVWHILQDVYHTGKTFEGRELLIPLARTADGLVEDRYFDFIYQARLNEQNETDGILVFVIEVTDNVKARQEIELSRGALEQTEQMLRFAIEAADVGTFSLDIATRQLNAGPRLKALFGYSPEQELTFEGMLAQVSPEFRQEVEAAIEVAIAGSTPFDMVYPLRDLSNGAARWVHAVGKTNEMAESGQTYFSGALTDISEQKKYEIELGENVLKHARLAAIVSASDDTIVSKTLQGIITTWNAAAERMFGYTEAEVVGKHISLIIPPSRMNEEDFIIGQVKAGKKVDHFETVRVAKDGREVPISLTVSPIFDAEGTIIGASKIARDISERQKDELRKSDFIGMVSHELKTPLTSLTALIQVAKSKLAKSEDVFLASAMAKAETQVRKMSTMINGFLNISRLESGKIAIDKQPFDMAELMHEVEQEVMTTYASHEIVFAPVEPTLVNADPDKIGHVINNLINNAVKYSAAGTRINVACQTVSGEAWVSVQDRGFGISDKDAENLFDRYYRVEDPNTKHISGFGIGLYLSAEIITRHEGKIWVESELGVGSTFHFSLPLA
ncbi:MAG: PAS domain S-box protein [Sphingobacteriales bacterium]